MKFLYLLVISFFITHSHAQSLLELSETISLYSDIVVNTERSESRIKFQPSLKNAIEEFLQTPGSFDFQFTDPLWVSVKDSEDKKIRLITWELRDEEGYQYFGFVQLSDGSYIELKDQSDDLDDIEYADLDTDFWYGNLYYNLITKNDAYGKTYYVAFGINKKDKFLTSKTAEVFSIENGKIKMGLPIFKDPTSAVKERLHLAFSSDANVTLNYNSGLGVIIFDHLISRMGNIPGQGPTKLPDGSYSGYKFSEGSWEYVDKMYNQISAVPPQDGNQNKSKNTKDIFGRTKN